MEPEPKDFPEIRYLLVLDFEATCEENVKLKPCSQIIQFPVKVLDTHTGQIISIFHHYVKPTMNTKLTKFCTELTGITQQQVDGGKVLTQVLAELDIWMKKLHKEQNGLKDQPAKNYTFVTCGDWDLMTCLRTQAKEKKIQYAGYLRQYINIKKYFNKVLGWDKQGRKTGGMMEMLSVLKIQHQGKHHSGIDDVTNICEICSKLIKDYGAKFQRAEVVVIKGNFNEIKQKK